MATNDLDKWRQQLEQLSELKKVDNAYTELDYLKLIKEWGQRKEDEKYKYAKPFDWSDPFRTDPLNQDSMDQWRRERQRDAEYRKHIIEIESELKELEHFIQISLEKMAESGFLTYILIKDPSYAEMLERSGFKIPKIDKDE